MGSVWQFHPSSLLFYDVTVFNNSSSETHNPLCDLLRLSCMPPVHGIN